jgi:hypothetical protein
VRSAAIAGSTFGEVQALAPGDGWRYGDLVALTGRLERPRDRDDVPLADVFARRGLLASLRATEAALLAREGMAARCRSAAGEPAVGARPGAPAPVELPPDGTSFVLGGGASLDLLRPGRPTGPSRCADARPSPDGPRSSHPDAHRSLDRERTTLDSRH